MTPTPAPFQSFPPDARLTGRFLFNKAPAAPGVTLVAQYRVAGGLQAAERATADAQGYFYFLTPGSGSFQVVWDDGGTLVTDPDTTIAGSYVSEALPVDPPDKSKPQVTMDLYWEPRPVPAPGGTFAGSFKFRKIPDLDAEYFIQVFDARRLGLYESAATTGEEVAWDKKGKDGEVLAPGQYSYKIKFKKPGSLWGAFEFFGATQFISFKIE